MENKFDIIVFNDENTSLEVNFDKENDTVWLSQKQMADLFTGLNVEKIATVKEEFNPDLHDAVMHIEDKEFGEQEVVEELRSGYKMGDRVLRHAMVKVAN